MGDEQDTKTMGALARFMPITSITFLVAWLAIGGMPPLSGFWSKGDVLQNAWALSPALWAVGALTAILTAYYIGRGYMLVFAGKARWEEAGVPGDGRAHTASALARRAGGRRDAGPSNPNAPAETGHQGEGHGAPLSPHDPSWLMTLPLVVLAIASIFAGFINLPFHPQWVLLERWLSPVVGRVLLVPHFGVAASWAFAVADAVFAAVGVTLSVLLWRSAVSRPAIEPVFLQRAWFIDWTYDRLLARGSARLAEFTYEDVETKVVDGAVNGLAAFVRRSGQVLRRVQTGYVRNYALGLLAGLVVILAYVLSRAFA
jgi:NADH:ubiquinone oxidoreductase subunit 5 (subunit L)/multisubunit Na+/H+ antiporter MnhA subunit